MTDDDCEICQQMEADGTRARIDAIIDRLYTEQGLDAAGDGVLD